MRPRKNVEWKTLQRTLQEDPEKIIYFRRIVKEWFESDDVNVLSKAQCNHAIFSDRDYSMASGPQTYGRVLGVIVDDVCQLRPKFPVAPPDFKWGFGKLEKKGDAVGKSEKMKKNKREEEEEEEMPRINPHTGRLNLAPFCPKNCLKKVKLQHENVVVPAGTHRNQHR